MEKYMDESKEKHGGNCKIVKGTSEEELIKFFAFMALCALAIVMIIGIFYGTAAMNCHVSEEKGMIQAGYYKVYKGVDYHAAVSQLQYLGFYDIQNIDLNKQGFLKLKEGQVESISIDGNCKFSANDYFYPGANILIRYF